MISVEEIFSLYNDRLQRLSSWHARALTIREICYGEIIVPLPEKDRAEMPATANVILLGIEQNAMRTASTMPAVTSPTIHLGRNAAEERARKRGQIVTSWWETNAMSLKMMKRARQFHAYAMAPVVIRPDLEYGTPCWHVRDPLTTFPPAMEPGEIHPDDCIFSYFRPFGYLRRRWPELAERIRGGAKLNNDTAIGLLEYVDDAEYVLLALAKHSNSWPAPAPPDAQPRLIELDRVPNLAGVPLAVVPGRISLEQPQGQFDGLVGMFQMQAKLMALELLAMERAVYPETWAVSSIAGAPPRIIQVADPTVGIVGEIEGGDIKTVRVEPSVLGTNFINTLERNMRVEGMIPSEYGGESSTNVRTGRRGDVILSQTVDYQIQAAHITFERSLECENKVAVAIDKNYFGRGARTIVSSTRGEFSYRPADVWETDRNYVRYSHAGTDINSLVVAAGQRMGLGTMSKASFMAADPMIEDPEAEADQIVVEQLTQAVLMGMQNMASQDPTMVEPLADILELVQTNKADLVDAYRKVQADYRAKQEQAQQGELPPEEAQPGITEPIPSVAEQPEGLQNLNFLLRSLHGNERTAAAG